MQRCQYVHELAYISGVDGARYGRPAPIVPPLLPIPAAGDWPAQTQDIGKLNTPPPTQSAAVEIPGTGISFEQEHHSLCSRCAAVGLDSIVSLQLHGKLHFVMDLDATKILKTKAFCSFCSLLSEVQPPLFGGDNARLALFAIEAPSPRFPSAIGTNLLAVLRLTRSIDEIVPSRIKNLSYIRALNKGQLPGISRSDVDYIPVRDWLNLCHEQHGRCLSSTASPVIPNLNVIDCVSMTLTNLPNGSTYVALSYVWGRTGSDGEAKHSGNLPVTFPATIRDAITVTKILNYRYLWIDRYCIPQQNDKDRHTQIRQMDRIYQKAELTIIAAADSDVESGLPGVGFTPRHILKASIGDRICVAVSDPRTLVKQSKWMSRAWTCQEAILSRRKLFFTEEQIYFECGESNYEEVSSHWEDCRITGEIAAQQAADLSIFPTSKAGDISEDASNMACDEDLWGVFRHIENYSGRALTYKTDILNGISGVLHIYETARYAVQHFLGIPILPAVVACYAGAPKRERTLKETPRSMTQAFAVALCWQTGPGQRRDGFPSWSWAGWTGQVKESVSLEVELGKYGYVSNAGRDVKVDFELIAGGLRSCDEVYSHGNPPDPTLFSPFIHIEAWTLPLQCRSLSPFRAYSVRGIGNNSRLEQKPSLSLSGIWVTVPDCQAPRPYFAVKTQLEVKNDEFYIRYMEGQSLIGIVIDTHPSPFVIVVRDAGDTYERVGNFALSKADAFFFLPPGDQHSEDRIAWDAIVRMTKLRLRLQ